ncbi:nucleotide cyclase [Dunaliella salina]|uniref:Nucleotide cyclase n=1 Tax=Dunaliella salina TaxID=3046 RepID=A0ABQ7G2R9_DUNSA|nr:nucleotide cyclase [Dunaliella salina]|eukprot:KAF5828905.1 nucleotide cyclase [Dunaliella salina]
MLVGEEACDAGTLTSHLQSQYSASTNGEQSNGLGLLTIPRETLEAKLQEWGETCFAPAGSHTEPCQQGNEDSAEDTARLVLVIILPILLCFIWSAVFCVKRLRKASGRTLFGQVKPPMEGPDSTLVVSDIEQSTALWEQLDEAVMDKAIALHHSCFRTYIFKHKGYEAQMEGDSFIIAFHDPQSAADFCIAVQCCSLSPQFMSVEENCVRSLMLSQDNKLCRAGCPRSSQSGPYPSSSSQRVTPRAPAPHALPLHSHHGHRR